MDGFINTIWVYCFISYLTISNILIHGCETNYMIQKFSKFGDELTLTENDRIFIQKLRRSSWQKCPKLSPYFSKLTHIQNLISPKIGIDCLERCR